MKRYLYMLLLLILGIVKNVNPQEINPLDFFPHHVGDLWQYVNYTQTGSEFWEKKITAIDTVWADSSKIITINYRNEFDFLHKIYFNDSLKIYWKTFGDWGIRYKFNVPLNTFWLSDPYFPYYAKYVREYEAVVFEDTILSREYWIGDSLFQLPLWTEHLALGIGEFYREFEIGITVLTGCIINGIQYGTIVSVEKEDEIVQPQNLQLSNYPNPFNSQTTIQYYLPTSSYINLSIFDILGRKIKEIFKDEELSGYHTKIWIPQNESSGIYLVVLRAEETQLINKIIYLK